MAIPLNSSALGSLPSGVRVPTYDRSVADARIVHFGVGAFHRSHQAMFVDELLSAGLSNWSICGVGVLPSDQALRDVFDAQDNLYTLLTISPDGQGDASVIGSITEYLFAPDDPRAVLDKLVDPATKIVSLTITEGGYGVDDVTGQYEPTDPDTVKDIASDAVPASAFGFLYRALIHRRANGIGPFTVMSCDNMPGNGDVARAALVGFAKLKDPQQAVWIQQRVAFPNSMVDRITPATTDEVRSTVSASFGIQDQWPVRSEAFRQWVLEDNFTAGRPPFETVGVQVVSDVAPYELMKLRLLNASHQAMSYLGILAGQKFVHDVCRDKDFREFLLGYMHQEAMATLQPVPGIDLDEYCQELIARFASEAIADTLARQVVDASDRIPKFLLPVLREQLSHGGEIRHCVLVLAAWSMFLEAQIASGGAASIRDRRAPELVRAIETERQTAGSFLDFAPVFGDLGASTRVRTAFVAARQRLAAHGARDSIREINSHKG